MQQALRKPRLNHLHPTSIQTQAARVSAPAPSGRPDWRVHAVWRSIATLRCVHTRCAARAARPTRRGRPRRQRARRRPRGRQRPRGRRRARRAAPGRHGARAHLGAALASGAWPPSSGRRGSGRLGTDPVRRRTSYYMMNTRHCGEVYFTGVILEPLAISLDNNRPHPHASSQK